MNGIGRMFVYGTLMPGRLRWPLLEPFATGHRPATVPGELYDAGRGWPVAVLADSPDGTGHVPGYVVELDPGSLAACLALIDDVEETETDELRRIEVVTTAGERAWAYHYTPSPAGHTRIAAWEAVPLALER
jgi:gamma-glutamylcyclotransferase (GGCT)/AIG2-like uncharacterized protein YtfP